MTERERKRGREKIEIATKREKPQRKRGREKKRNKARKKAEEYNV